MDSITLSSCLLYLTFSVIGLALGFLWRDYLCWSNVRKAYRKLGIEDKAAAEYTHKLLYEGDESALKWGKD